MFGYSLPRHVYIVFHGESGAEFEKRLVFALNQLTQNKPACCIV